MTTAAPLSAAPSVSAAQLLVDLFGPAPADDVARIGRLRVLEELACAAAGAQARIALDFEASQRAEQRAAGVKAGDLGRGIAAQIGLARRVSPNKGRAQPTRPTTASTPPQAATCARR